MKKSWKIFIWILVGVVVFILGLDSGFRARQAWEPQRALRSFLKFQDAWEDLYRQDKYGGQTPEETIDLFLNALKADDLDLASKYFVLDKQEEWYERLGEIQQEGNLERMIEDLSRAEKHKEDGSFAWFYILHEDKTGQKYSSVVVMERNNLSDVWKISKI